MKKNISPTPFMHHCSPVLKQQWQQPTKAPGCFCVFKKHQWFSQWGGVLWEQINNASGFLWLRLHPPIRESSLHRTEGDMGPLEGTRGDTQKLSGDNGGGEPIRWFSSEFFCSSHPQPCCQEQAWLLGTEITCSQQLRLTRRELRSLLVYLLLRL